MTENVTVPVPNGLKRLREFFSTPTKPVDGKELREFWLSLSDWEKDYFKTAALK